MLSVDVIAPGSFPPLHPPFLLSRSLFSTHVEKFGCTLLLVFFYFGFAGGDTLTESGKGCAPPSPNLHYSSTAAVLAHQVVQQERGIWELGAVYRETKGSSRR